METNFQLLLLSPNLLKSKVPIFRVGGACGNQFPTFVAESKFALKNFFFWGKNFVSFQAKMCLGMVLDF